MRAKIHATAELPIKLDQFIEEVTRLSSLLDDTLIWSAKVTAEDAREGQPAQITLMLSGEVEPPDPPF